MWHIYSAGALVSCVLCALVAATWMRVTYVPHESLNSCSPPLAWLPGGSRVVCYGISLARLQKKQCGEHLLCVQNNAVKYKYICICIGSPTSYKRGLEVSALCWQKKNMWKKLFTFRNYKWWWQWNMQINLTYGIQSPTVNAAPYAEMNIKAHWVQQ